MVMLEKTRSRNRSKKSKTKTKEERDHLAKVKALPCIICGSMPCDAHHIREGYGMSQRANDFETIPLCKAHHQYGPEAIHSMGTKAWRAKYGSELELLARTNEAIKRRTGD